MALDIGDVLPDDSVVSTEGVVSLRSFLRPALVLYFYPRDHTPGCTTESMDFRDHYPAFQEAGYEVVGVSRDKLSSHQRFQDKLLLPFSLIADPEELLCTVFGVMKNKVMYGKPVRGIDRSTFVMDASGHIVQVWRSIKVPGHVATVLSSLKG